MSDKNGEQVTILDRLDGAIDLMQERGAKPKLIRLTPDDWQLFNEQMSDEHAKHYVFSYRNIQITSGAESQVESE